jgi:hypothetical protein
MGGRLGDFALSLEGVASGKVTDFAEEAGSQPSEPITARWIQDQ